MRKSLARAQADLGKRTGDVRWIPVDQLHLTMKFLGDVPDADVPAVTEAVGLALFNTLLWVSSNKRDTLAPPRK